MNHLFRRKLLASFLLTVLHVFLDSVNGQSFLDRVWKDQTGQFSVQAQLRDVTEAEAILQTADGRNIRVPKNKLSPEDLQFLEAVDYTRESFRQYDLIMPHAERMIISPDAVSEIIAELHKQFPKGVAAGLFSGCIFATQAGKAGLKDAVEFTDETISRLRALNKELPAVHRQTLTSALNNRAVLAIRERQPGRAVTNLKQAALLSEDVPFVVYHNATILLEVSSQPNSLLKLDRTDRQDLVQLLAQNKPEGPGTNIPKRFMYSTAHDEFSTIASPSQEVTAAAEPTPRVAELPPIQPGYQLASFGSGFLVSPNLVLTNRHVVEGHELGLRFRVRNEGTLSDGSLAYVKKVSEIAEIDLGLLELGQPVSVPPLPLRQNLPRLGESLTVLGYPDPERFEPTLTSSNSVVNKLTDNQTNILHDAATNGGNSGGPCLDDMGNVIGVHYASKLTQSVRSDGVVTGGSMRKSAVVSTAAISFLSDISNYSQLPPRTAPLSLPDMIENSGPSVVQIEVWADATQIRQLQANDIQTESQNDPLVALRRYSLWPEQTCLLCNGTGFQDCPKCIGGVISVKKRVQVATNPLNGQPIYGTRVFKEKCDFCGGKTGAVCRACNQGVLPLFD